MLKKDGHCSFCGSRYPEAEPWPRRCRACRNTSYRNPLPVVVVLLPIGKGLVVIRRNIEPQKGTLALPGGYLDLGESWRQGARRELLEETGIAVAAEEISLYDVQNGLDDTLVIFGLARPQPLALLQPFSSLETREVLLIEEPIALGFALHTEVVRRFFAQGERTSELLEGHGDN